MSKLVKQRTAIVASFMLALVALTPPAAAQWEEAIYPHLPYGVNQVDYPQQDQPVATATTDTTSYLVQAGDTLSKICRQHQVTVARLLQVNQLANPDLLIVGQKLTVPTGAKASTDSNILAQCPWPAPTMALPAAGEISSHFGIRQEGRPHQGVDIAAPQGAAIKAPLPGQVKLASPYGSYGNTVIIDHGGDIQSLYAHCSTLLVHQGQKVTQGQVIAQVGNTGRSFGPHLHWEVHYQGIPFDPLLCTVHQ